MPPFSAVSKAISTLSFLSRNSLRSQAILLTPTTSLARNYSSSFSGNISHRNGAAEDVFSKDLKDLPVSKYLVIKKIPDAIKYPLFEKISKDIIQDGFDNPIQFVTSQIETQKYADFIIDTLAKESKSGNNEDAVAMKKVYTDFASGKLSHFHIEDSFPLISVGKDCAPSTNREFSKKVGIDNTITSPEDSAEKILENVANIVFAFSSLYAMGYNYPNQQEKPIFCFRTTHPQYPHTDSVTSDQSLALALYGINADGSVKTYVVDIQQVLYFLEPKEIELLQQKVFYIPHEGDSLKSANPQKLFSILEFKNDKILTRFDGKRNTIYIDDSVDMETVKNTYYAIEKINVAVERMLAENKVTNVGLKTGQYLALNNRTTLHGREEESNKFAGYDKPYSTSLQTFSGAERRVVRMLAGAPECNVKS